MLEVHVKAEMGEAVGAQEKVEVEEEVEEVEEVEEEVLVVVEEEGAKFRMEKKQLSGCCKQTQWKCGAAAAHEIMARQNTSARCMIWCLL